LLLLLAELLGLLLALALGGLALALLFFYVLLYKRNRYGNTDDDTHQHEHRPQWDEELKHPAIGQEAAHVATDAHHQAYNA
jgi:hypothetical protein